MGKRKNKIEFFTQPQGGDVINFDEVIEKASIEQPKYIQKSIYINGHSECAFLGGLARASLILC